jgi:hypothetical protein
VLLAGILIVVAYVTQGNLALITALGLGGAYTIFKMVLDLPVAQWINDLFSKGHSYGSAIGYMEEIRNDIRALKKQLPTDAKIVVIIDDLDRCGADKIVDTLEAVKLLLNFDIFVVFLAIDSNVIARAVETRYKEILAEAGRSGYLYLDKIVQIPFRIPEPEPDTLNKYLFSLLAAVDLQPTGTVPVKRAKQIAGKLLILPAVNENLEKFIAALPDDWILNGPADISIANVELYAKSATPPVVAHIVWWLLIKWWPVTTFLMHDRMRTTHAKQIATDRTRPALIQLAEMAEQQAALDIQAQRLREVVDAPLDKFQAAIAAAPALSYEDLRAVVVSWKQAYPITVGFTPAELEAFQNLSSYLARNPRHIKRLVNTYSLIRMLAARAPNGEVVLNAPEAMLKWLILSSQWPVTSQVMLEAFSDELELIHTDEALPKDDDALGRLFQEADKRIAAHEKLQRERSRLDGDPSILARLVGDSLRVLTSEQLHLLRAYSINFNPAEGNLASLAMEKVPEKEKEGEKPE